MTAPTPSSSSGIQWLTAITALLTAITALAKSCDRTQEEEGYTHLVTAVETLRAENHDLKRYVRDLQSVPDEEDDPSTSSQIAIPFSSGTSSVIRKDPENDPEPLTGPPAPPSSASPVVTTSRVVPPIPFKDEPVLVVNVRPLKPLASFEHPPLPSWPQLRNVNTPRD